MNRRNTPPPRPIRASGRSRDCSGGRRIPIISRPAISPSCFCTATPNGSTPTTSVDTLWDTSRAPQGRHLVGVEEFAPPRRVFDDAMEDNKDEPEGEPARAVAALRAQHDTVQRDRGRTSSGPMTSRSCIRTISREAIRKARPSPRRWDDIVPARDFPDTARCSRTSTIAHPTCTRDRGSAAEAATTASRSWPQSSV